MATLKELLAQKEAIEQQIAQTKKEERADAVAKVHSLMAEYGLTLADIGGKTTPKAKAKSGGGKVAPKYRNASTGESWSGRGLQPRWLKAALASGKKLSDFVI